MDVAIRSLHLIAALVLAATGAEMAADRLPSWDALTDTEWGEEN